MPPELTRLRGAAAFLSTAPVAIALSLAFPLVSPAAADTLVDNVDGFTLDQAGQIERLDGLLIGDDGRIVQVLHRGEKRPGKVDYRLDGQGRVLMPGLIDSQVSLDRIGFAALTLDLSGTATLAAAQARIAAYAAAHPDRPWILGRGWDEARWSLGRSPNAADLDLAVRDRPVWLERADGHAGWANSAALAAAGIGPTTRAPRGGRIERTAAGAATGTLTETAMVLVERAIPAPRPEDRDLALATAQDLLLRRGVTAVSDIGTSIEDWQALRRAGDAGTLRLRIMAYAAGTEAMQLIGGPGPGPWLYADRLRLNGVALSFDGGIPTRGAALAQPYADLPATAPNRTGLPRLDGTQLRNLMSRAAIDRFQVFVMAQGDAAATTVLDAVQELAQTYTGDRRWRLGGSMVMAPADVARAGSSGAAAGTVIGMVPSGLAAQLPVLEVRLGPGRLPQVQPWASLTAGGGHLVAGSDAPATAPDPWAMFATLITRQNAAAEPFDGWQPQERLSREAALATLTSAGAYAGFAEGRFGRLAPGQRADFLLVDRDPLLASPGELRAMRVLETWVGGQRVWAAQD